MNDRDLAVWLQGAATMIGDRTPTEFEWAAIKEKVDEVVAERVKAKLIGAPTTGMAPALGDITSQNTSQTL